MTLPTSAEYPEEPIRVPHRSEPPPIIPVNHPEINPILVDIGLSIARVACEQAGANPVRMFAYNLLCNNHWNNPHYFEVFQLVLDFIQHALQTTSQPVLSLYGDGVVTMMRLWSSDLAFKYPELQNYMTPRQVEASAQNSGLLNKMKKENFGMHPQQYSHHQQPQHGYGQPVQQQVPQFITVLDVYGNPVNIPTAQFSGASQGHHQQQRPGQPHPSVVRSEVVRDFGGQPDRNTSMSERHDYTREPLKQSQHFPRSATSSRFDDAIEEVVTSRQSSGEQDVDREKHRLHQPSPVASVEQTRQTEVVQQKKAVDVIIVEKCSADLDLNSLVATARSQAQLPDNEGQIRRHYFFIPTTLVSTIDIEKLLKSWLVGDTLSDIAKHLKDKLNSLAADASDAATTTKHLTLWREVNRKLTDTVNVFLELNFDDLNIDSFVGDIDELSAFILKRFGRTGRTIYNQFDTSLASMLSTHHAFDVMKDFDAVEPEEGTYFGYLPRWYSATFVPLDAEQLELNVKETNQVSKIAGMLYEIIHPLMKGIVEENSPIHYGCETHFIITQDGVRFKIAYRYGVPDTYLLKRA